MVETNKHIIFPDFIHRLRKQQKLTLKQLCKGLCGPETIASLENGEMLPNKLLQDLILDRLGVGAEDYEHLLPDAEYQRWAVRQRILHLRDTGRVYFLWEILELQERLLKITLQKELPENTHVEYEAVKGTFDYCYLYVERRVSCLNDAIRIRREMLGMSRRELAEGICDKKTLERLERKQVKTHLAIVQDLLVKLRLPADHTRTEPAPAGIVFNRQALRNKELLIRWKKNEISNEEYLRQMRETLELTLPFNAFLKEGEKYLTSEEQRCILNMMEAMDPGSPEYNICIQRFHKIWQAYTEELTCAHPDTAAHGSG